MKCQEKIHNGKAEHKKLKFLKVKSSKNLQILKNFNRKLKFDGFSG